ncbi:TOPRIM nucleotidyl transferase/hydrolase domain-containing protein [Micromonospora antibiotica]|uniref:TOPRIM nucleotidyl transferase/hydrolase domain-containing protein n=1 Tax=Micromonospora antibiotica TaxID=2807623 RepID=UPI0027DBF7BE|nr:TOPRIM nucleotidyl transferase/hydrolase domain-containing protein [Micromonospora antibiotica]
MREPDRFRAAVRAWAAGGADAAGAAVIARRLAGAGVATVVLVEGVSDRSAVEALAVRRDRDLTDEGVYVLPMGGAMSAGRFLRLLGPPGLGLAVRGLCDEAEEGWFRRALEQVGLGVDLSRTTMEALGFPVCVADLEDELIRALGPSGVEDVLDTEGDLPRFRVFQNQPAQRGRSVQRQLRRFLGTTSGRKARYAAALVHALDLDHVPRPLDRVLPRRRVGSPR